MTSTPERYAFADFELDASAGLLLRAGAPVHLTPKAFAVLTQLVRARGALVTRDALFDAHWAGMVVGSDALTRCIVELRRALEDDPKAPRFIATAHRRGFRFVASMARPADPSSAPAMDHEHAPSPPAPHARSDVADGRPPAARAPQPTLAPPTGLLGRNRELAQADAMLDAARNGHGAVLCIHGEPGIGKSHLLEEIEQRARIAGMRSLQLRGDASLPPEVFGGPRADNPAGGATRSPDRALIAGELSGWDAPAAHARLLDIRARAIIDAAHGAPLLLACDDLERAGADMLGLLLRIADDCTRAPIVLALAWRDVGRPDNPDFDAVLAALPRIRAPRADMPLRGLAAADALQLARREGAALGAAELERTGGNPLFVGELARLAAHTPASARTHTLPQGLRHVLRARLAMLAPATRAMLDVAAVAGLHGRRALLAVVAGLAPTELDAALEDAIRERLLLLDDGDHWRFAHALVRDALYEAQLPGARARLHSAVGHAHARLANGANEPPLAEIAMHFERGLPEDAPRAIELGHRAGVHALNAGACHEGARRLDQAIEQAGTRTDTPPDMLCDMLMAAGYAHALCGRPQRARALAQRALQHARTAAGAAAAKASPQDAAAGAASAGTTRDSAGERLVRALRLCCDLEPSYPHQPAIAQWLEEALERVDPEDTATRAELLARQSFQAYLLGNTTLHAAMAADAVRLARSSHGPGMANARALDDALTSQAYALTHPQHEHALRALHDERMGLVRALGDRHREFDVRRQRLEQALQVGPWAAVQDEYERLAALGALLDTPSTRATLLRARAGFAIAEARLDDAWQLAQDALAEGQHATDTGTVGAIAMLQFGAILGMRDDGGRVAPELRDQPATPNSLVKAAMIYLAAHHGAADYARWQLRALAEDDFAALPRDATHGVALTNLAMSCEVLADAEVAARLYPLLLPWAERSLPVLCYYNAGCGARFLGLLASTLGRHEDAANHFNTALAVDTRMRATAWRLHTVVDYVRTLRQHVDAAHRARLHALLAGARDEIAALGLGQLLRIADGLLASHG